MNLKNALKLTFLNNNMVIKSLVYRLFFFTLYATVSYLLLSDFFVGFGSFSFSLEYFSKYLDTSILINNLSANKGKIILFIFVSLVIGGINNFADSSIVDIVNNHMSVFSREGFFGSFLRNLKHTISYALLYSFYNLVFTFICLVISYLIIIALYDIISVFALPFVIIFFVIAISFKQTLISQLLPYMIINRCSVFKAVINNDFNKRFFPLLSDYILAYSLIIYINISAGILTLGAGLVLSVPLSFILLDIIGLTSYYEIHVMKYYITYDLKCIPKELRDNEENLLNDMDI